MKKIVSLLVFAVFAAMSLYAGDKQSVSILGDSYSTFEGYIEPESNITWYYEPVRDDRTDLRTVDQTWWHRFIKENGYKLCKNTSYSGSTVCNRGYEGDDYTDRSFLTRCKNLGNPDIILIFGATNDSWAGVPIGEYKYEGQTKGDLYTFRPALAKMMRMVTERYPNVEIYYIINDGLKDEIVESINTVCKHYNVPTIQLTGIDKINGHPSIKGMGQISDQLKAFMAKR